MPYQSHHIQPNIHASGSTDEEPDSIICPFPVIHWIVECIRVMGLIYNLHEVLFIYFFGCKIEFRLCL